MTRYRPVALAAWSLCGLDVGVVAALLVLGSDGSGPWGTFAAAVFILAFATTGALVASRIPRNPIGWLLCGTALAFAIGGVCVQVSEQAVRENQAGGAVSAAAWVGTFVWMLGVGPAATYVLLLFPDGHLPSRRWRPVAWFTGVALTLTWLGLALAPGPIEDTRVVNPIGVEAWESLLLALENAGLLLLFVSILASCASLAVRYRTAGPEQRAQLKWLAWSLPLVVAWLAGSIWVESTRTGETWVDIANMLVSIGLTFIPVAIAVAVLKHRLYDIDVVINRSLVYGALTATLAVVYLSSVLLLQRLLSPVTESSDLAVAAATLAVAGLFRPARTRIQSVVDRRFYRRRYDAARTLEAFGLRLRDQLDVESLGADLRTVVAETMAPAHVSLWMRGVS